MKTLLLINDRPISAKEFAYDGCHKIYLIFNAQDRAEMLGLGYSEEDIYPVSDLPAIWGETCPLRFISRADLQGKNYVEQCAPKPKIQIVTTA